MKTIVHYLTADCKDPYQEWLNSLKDPIAKAKITTRINRLSAGSFGDCKPLRESVWELRIDQGPGYRVYYAQIENITLLLLSGGDKRKQQADIEKAIVYLRDYQSR
ncbi:MULTISPECIES: type II toxin-antitoxin system RelE/ParE family toxin [Serratia]|uniref:Type II toxin-antitoxin system RelE/ParE family toxin n=1 Tax=Serratia quinivorans TaxID=137545 RepID=A0ABV3UKB2_9GAMM|nr:type II toxin-antitoxin system RelE/ParE family toxin [Serratia sp. S4]